MDEFNRYYPDIPLYLRGDSGFADIMIYETLESNGVSYAICMKENGRLRMAASFIEDELIEKTKHDQIDYASVMANFSIKLTAGFIQEGASARWKSQKVR